MYRNSSQVLRANDQLNHLQGVHVVFRSLFLEEHVNLNTTNFKVRCSKVLKYIKRKFPSRC